MEIRKAYAGRDGNAVIVCPHCGTSKTVSVVKFRHSRGGLKVRCTCRSEFTVLLEFRAAYRKKTHLPGHYTKMPVSWGDMVVKNISLTGMAFETAAENHLKVGDEVTVKFTLDDESDSVVKKKVIVKVLRGKYVGSEFPEPVHYDKALGFYLVS